jgi:hypothetical protein
MPPGRPEKQLRWGRLIFAILLLAGIIAGVIVLVIR